MPRPRRGLWPARPRAPTSPSPRPSRRGRWRARSTASIPVANGRPWGRIRPNGPRGIGCRSPTNAAQDRRAAYVQPNLQIRVRWFTLRAFFGGRQHYRLALVAVATLFACKTRHAGNESRARRVERVHRPGVADRREREADGRAGTRHLPRRYVG